jgi:hypothetical protein
MSRLNVITCVIPGPGRDQEVDPEDLAVVFRDAIHWRLGDTSTVKRYGFSFTLSPRLEPDDDCWVMFTIEFEPVSPALVPELAGHIEQMFTSLEVPPRDFEVQTRNANPSPRRTRDQA